MTARVIASIVFAAALMPGRAQVAPATSPTPAFRLADSVGVNVHLHHTDTPYNDFDLVRSRLVELGVRHVRDGLIATTWQPYYDRHNALGAAGIKGVFIAPAAIADADLRTYPSRMAQAFEAFEAPNEFDVNGGPDWPGILRQSLGQLRALRAAPGFERFPLYGPSLTSEAAFAAMGDVSSLVDAANIHNYFAGRHPGTGGWGPNGYGSIAWNVRLAERAAPGRMIVATETGYWDDPALPESVPPEVVGRYMPRLLFEQLRAGITRTYLYELIDDRRRGVAGASGYGLIRADGTPKPAFRAVAALLRLFADSAGAGATTPVEFTVSGGDGDLRRQLFQKSDGSLLLALWVEREGYDLAARRRITVPAQTVSVTFPPSFTLRATHRWRDDGSAAESPAGAGQSTISLSVDDAITVLSFAPRDGGRVPQNIRIRR